MIIDHNKYFVVCTNMCKEGLGEVILPHYHEIFYETLKLRELERKITQLMTWNWLQLYMH